MEWNLDNVCIFYSRIVLFYDSLGLCTSFRRRLGQAIR